MTPSIDGQSEVPKLPELATLDRIYAKQDWWRNRLVNARNRKAQAENTIEQCYQHVGPLVVVTQIAEAMAPHFPDHHLDVLGPFGLGSTTAIHAVDPEGITVASLSFRPVGDFLGLVDYNVDTMEYPPNSLGGINGFNHPTTDIPLGGIESLVALLRTRIETKNETMLNRASTNQTYPDVVGTLLNNYEGDDIWADLIKPLDGYNEFATLAQAGPLNKFIVNFRFGKQVQFRLDKGGRWKW